MRHDGDGIGSSIPGLPSLLESSIIFLLLIKRPWTAAPLHGCADLVVQEGALLAPLIAASCVNWTTPHLHKRTAAARSHLIS